MKKIEKFNYLFLIFFLLYFNNLFSYEYCYFIKSSKDLKKLKFNKKCEKIYIEFGTGDFIINSPIIIRTGNSKLRSIVIKGRGIKNTNLIITNKESAIIIFQSTKNSTTIIKDLSIYAKRDNIKYAIYYSQGKGGNQHRRNLILQNIEIANYKNKKRYFFKNGIYLIGPWRPLIDNIFITGFYGPLAKGKEYKMNNGFYLEGVYSPTITNSRCWSSKIGLNLISNIKPGPEGVMIDHCKFVQNLIGINIEFTSKELGGFITNNHINALKIGINVKKRKFLIISNNLLYMNKYHKLNYIYIRFENVDKSIIANNIFHYPSKKKSHRKKEIYLINSFNNIIINNIITHKTNFIYGNHLEKNIIKSNYILK